jgi:taurine dioxygenase
MNISYANNGWTIFIDNDINSLSHDEIIQVAKLIVTNMVVVFKKQNLTPEQELKFCNVIGNHQYYPASYERGKHIRLNDGILRVTGKKNEYGEPGLFGHTSALDWHANQPSNKERKPLIWLYGAEGTKGSRTSWLNNIASYQDLPIELKNEIDNLQIFCGYKKDKYSSSSYFIEHVNESNPVNLVQTNKEGKKGLFFPFLQIFGFKDKDENYFKSIMQQLIKHVVQEKYMYHHDWDDGDVVISEQILSIHKRWAFDDMENRVLHRIAFDYSNVYR